MKYFWAAEEENASPYFDRQLLWMIFGLMLLGITMVTSASMSISPKGPFYYTDRQLIQLSFALFLVVLTLYIPIKRWQQASTLLLIFSVILLFVVLIAGTTINGASRWISIGTLNFQPAELSKLALFCFISRYLVRKTDEVQNIFWGFFKPMAVMLILAVLLLLQPDLGTVIVLFMVTISILFITGAKLWQFIFILLIGLIAVAILILWEPYRVTRLLTFLDPWKDPTGSGYQLTTSLMAIGNGGWFGQGLGNSIRKLGYLPEAHTDFIFSIIAEELGYVGVIGVLCLLFGVAFKALAIGYRALNGGFQFAGYLACQIGIWFGFQTFVNVGVTTAMLPTKGLTLPFISYGGSSLIVMSVAVAIILRIDYELKQAQIKVKSSK